MDIKARIDELTQQQQEGAVNIQRLAGAIAILTEQLGDETAEQAAPVLEEVPEQASPNGKVEEEVKV